jgi:hypothetical protein
MARRRKSYQRRLLRHAWALRQKRPGAESLAAAHASFTAWQVLGKMQTSASAENLSSSCVAGWLKLSAQWLSAVLSCGQLTALAYAACLGGGSLAICASGLFGRRDGAVDSREVR